MHRKAEFDKMVKGAGGRFKLTVLIQKRIQELAKGAPPLVQLDGRRTLIDIAIEEIHQGKVFYDMPVDEDEGRGRKKKE